ncbi:hypothetical protein VW098_08120 [Phaeobacter sp. JH57H2]|uniref:hypothetical protein n=1 Tax=unclassified Phaeobacter TaxID=2621772 RepID=UPI003A8AC572
MAMTQSEIRSALHRTFSSYATKLGRANLVLGSNMAVLRREAEIAKLPSAVFDEIAREEMLSADKRMQADAARHPIKPPVVEVV